MRGSKICNKQVAKGRWPADPQEADAEVAVGIEGRFQQVMQPLETASHAEASHTQQLQASAKRHREVLSLCDCRTFNFGC